MELICSKLSISLVIWVSGSYPKEQGWQHFVHLSVGTCVPNHENEWFFVLLFPLHLPVFLFHFSIFVRFQVKSLFNNFILGFLLYFFLRFLVFFRLFQVFFCMSYSFIFESCILFPVALYLISQFRLWIFCSPIIWSLVALICISLHTKSLCDYVLWPLPFTFLAYSFISYLKCWLCNSKFCSLNHLTSRLRH